MLQISIRIRDMCLTHDTTRYYETKILIRDNLLLKVISKRYLDSVRVKFRNVESNPVLTSEFNTSTCNNVKRRTTKKESNRIIVHGSGPQSVASASG